MRRFAPLLVALLVAAPVAAATPELDREIERLRKQLVELGHAEAGDQGEAQALRARLEALNARESVVRAQIDRNRGELARLLGALQMHSRHPPPPLLVSPRSAKDAVRAAILIRAITPELEARGRVFADQAEAVARVRREAAVASETLFQTESDVADRRAEIERLIAQKRSLEGARFGADPAEAETRALAARVGSVGELVQELAVRRPVESQAAPARFAAPVRGDLLRRYGDEAPGQGRSQGWTWRAAPAATVLSPASGRVEYSGPLKGWGSVVILRIGGGYRLVLAGLESADVGVGRQVTVGEPVGRMTSNAAQGRGPRVQPELYLEVRNGASTVDPARWLSPDRRG
jgi:septal ring factor EnvC (AmiA/AmiB activator)